MNDEERHASFYLNLARSYLETPAKGGAVAQHAALRAILPQIQAAQRWAAGHIRESSTAAQACVEFARLLRVDGFAHLLTPDLRTRWVRDAQHAAAHQPSARAGMGSSAESSRRPSPKAQAEDLVRQATIRMGNIGIVVAAQNPDEAAPDPEALHEIELLTTQGQAHYDAGRLQAAMTDWNEGLRRCELINVRLLDEAILLGNLGMAYSDLNVLDKSIELKQEALALARDFDSELNVAIQLQNLGYDYCKLNNLPKADAMLTEALALHRAARRERQEAQTLSTLAQVFASRNDIEGAVRLEERAIDLARRLGDGYLVSQSSTSLATLSPTISTPEYTLSLAQQALEAARRASNVEARACALDGLAHASLFVGDEDAVRRYDTEALRLLETLELPHLKSQVQARLDSLATVDTGTRWRLLRRFIPKKKLRERQRRTYRAIAINAMRTGDTKAGLIAAHRLLRLARDGRVGKDELFALLCLGEWHFAAGLSALAADVYTQARTIAESLDDKRSLTRAFAGLGYASADHGDYVAAELLHRAALDTAIAAGSEDSIAATRIGVAIATDALGRYDEAIEMLHEVVRAAANDRWLLASALGNLGYAMIGPGHYEEAEAFLVRSLEVSRQVGSHRMVNYMSSYLAVARLLGSRPAAAIDALAMAAHASDASNNHFVSALEGLALTLDGDAGRARDALERAVWCSDRLLLQSPSYHRARYSAALALTLLAADEDGAREANDAMTAAIAACSAIGLMKRFRALADLATAVSASDARPR